MNVTISHYMAVSALLFAIVHLNLPSVGARGSLETAGSALALFLPIFLTGLALAALYHRTGSLAPGIIAHAVNNATAFGALFFGAAQT